MERADILFPLRHREMGCKQKHEAWEKFLRQGRLEESIPIHPPLMGKKIDLPWAWGTMEVPRWAEEARHVWDTASHPCTSSRVPANPARASRKESNQEREEKKKKKKARKE